MVIRVGVQPRFASRHVSRGDHHGTHACVERGALMRGEHFHRSVSVHTRSMAIDLCSALVQTIDDILLQPTL